MLLGKQKLLVTSENNPCTQVGSQQTNQTVPQRRKKKSQQFITNNKRASYSGKPSYHVTDTIRLGTYQLFGAFLRLQSGFFHFLPSVSKFLSVGVILPLTLSPFSPPCSLPSVPSFVRTAPVLFHESAQVPKSKKTNPLQPCPCFLLHSCADPLPPSPLFRCGSRTILIWLCTHIALPGPPAYLPFS